MIKNVVCFNTLPILVLFRVEMWVVIDGDLDFEQLMYRGAF